MCYDPRSSMRKRKQSVRIPPETSLARYDWTRARRGYYASRFPRMAHVILLSPELYERFGSARAVTEALEIVVRLREIAEKPPARPKRTAA